jgi:hypothetical protein
MGRAVALMASPFSPNKTDTYTATQKASLKSVKMRFEHYPIFVFNFQVETFQ